MPDEEIAFQLMRLYRVLRGAGDAGAKDSARHEIDRLLHEFDSRPHPPVPSNDNLGISRLQR